MSLRAASIRLGRREMNWAQGGFEPPRSRMPLDQKNRSRRLGQPTQAVVPPGWEAGPYEHEAREYDLSLVSADPKAEQCGWLKDRFGVSWQIVPTAMDAMLASKDKARIARVTKAYLK